MEYLALYVLGGLITMFIISVLLGKPDDDYPVILFFIIWPIPLLIWLPYIAIDLGDKLRNKWYNND